MVRSVVSILNSQILLMSNFGSVDRRFHRLKTFSATASVNT